MIARIRFQHGVNALILLFPNLSDQELATDSIQQKFYLPPVIHSLHTAYPSPPSPYCFSPSTNFSASSFPTTTTLLLLFPKYLTP